MSTYQPVPFNEGAPLDPSLLMKLQSNVTEAYTKATKVENSTKTNTYTIKSDCGKEEVSGLTGNKHGKKTISVPEFGASAIVVATPALSFKSKEQITITITAVTGGQFDLNVVSSDPSREKLWINWHISQKS